MAALHTEPTLNQLAGLPTKGDLRIAQRFIPKNATEHKHALGVCYTEDTTRGPAQRPYFLVLAYNGTASKKAFYEGYSSREPRDKRVSEFFAGLESSAAMKAGYKEEKAKPHTLKVGDVIHHSWGWEQTQCDFYQVLAVTAHGATIHAIASEAVPGSEGFMSERQTAVKDSFHGEPLKVRVDGGNRVTTLAHGSAGLWDGRPKYCSWYA